ncbi:hypothetical protein [Methylobacterium sp. SyP6R]|uniref:hypothetical protein n=1 Tax=Methylobacterium sp. SyP6R TaxID=2718876 RepID=UPI001F39F939|nr:hypothetical protein [Methylobacterium sp. SyP6R]MCF4126885.1 hypothetical protein [Methylobacterium sp. SyP6R]
MIPRGRPIRGAVHSLTGKDPVAFGMDADFCLSASDKCVILSDDMVDDRTGFTPYAGRIVTGRPDSVLRRGRVVAEGGA